MAKNRKEKLNLMIGFNVRKFKKINNPIHPLMLKIRIKRLEKLQLVKKMLLKIYLGKNIHNNLRVVKINLQRLL